jgi:hypothetical protein
MIKIIPIPKIARRDKKSAEAFLIAVVPRRTPTTKYRKIKQIRRISNVRDPTVVESIISPD